VAPRPSSWTLWPTVCPRPALTWWSWESKVWAVPGNFDPGVGSALVLAHGAGAGMNHEFIRFFHEGLASNGVLSVKFNFPYMEAGRKAPDRSDKLEETFRKVLEVMTNDGLGADRIFIGGKSMGGRMASHLVARGTRVAGLVLLGYPLHPPGKPGQLRVAHFSEIRCPALFVQGTRDNDLFHVANCLRKGGMSEDNMRIILQILCSACDPPFDERDTIGARGPQTVFSLLLLPLMLLLRLLLL